MRLQPEQSIDRKDRRNNRDSDRSNDDDSHFPQTSGAKRPTRTTLRQTQSRCGSNPCNVMNYAASHHFKPNSHRLFVFLGGSIQNDKLKGSTFLLLLLLECLMCPLVFCRRSPQGKNTRRLFGLKRGGVGGDVEAARFGWGCLVSAVCSVSLCLFELVKPVCRERGILFLPIDSPNAPHRQHPWGK